MTLARKIAEFVVSLDMSHVPDDVAEKVDVCLLNGFGIALGSASTPYFRVAANAALSMSGSGHAEASLLFLKRKTSIDGAILSNAALFHGRAQEDTCGTVHVGPIAIPLLTALAEAGRGQLRMMKAALLAGYEVSGLLDLAYGRLTSSRGFRATPLYGSIGAAAAAGKFMNFSVEELESAICNAAALTGGTLQAFADGTDEWRYQVGAAGRVGWLAASLARAGSVSSRCALEGNSGFIRSFAGVTADVEALTSRLNSEWSIRRVTFKPYPVCAFNQTPVMAALALRHKLEGRRPLRVRVRMNSFETSYAGMDSHGPFNSISGTLMSIPFCIAVTLLYGPPDIARMSIYDDPVVAALMQNVRIVTDDSVPNLSAVLEVDLPENAVMLHTQTMTPADYSYNWDGVSQLVRRIGREQQIEPATYDKLETFVRKLSDAKIDSVVSLFG